MASPVRKLPKLNGSLQVIPVKRRLTCCTFMEFQCSLNWFYRERQSFPWPLVQNIMTSCAMFQFDFSSAFKARGMFVKKWSKISPCSPRIFSHVWTTQLERSHQKAIKMKKLWRSPWHSQSSSYKTGKRAPTKFSLHLTQDKSVLMTWHNQGNLDLSNVRMMNTKVNQQTFWHCFENGLIKTIQMIPHNLCVSFKSASLYCGLRLILVYPQ